MGGCGRFRRPGEATAGSGEPLKVTGGTKEAVEAGGRGSVGQTGTTGDRERLRAKERQQEAHTHPHTHTITVTASLPPLHTEL